MQSRIGKRPMRELSSRSWDVQQIGIAWPQRTNWNSCLDQVIQIHWRWGGHRLKRQRCHLVCHSMRCSTGSQWSDLRSGLASVWPRWWQTTLARLFCCTRCSTPKLQPGHRRARRYSSYLEATILHTTVWAPSSVIRVRSCTPSLPPWRDSRIAGANQLLCRVTSSRSLLPATSTSRILADDRSWGAVPRMTTSDLSALSCRLLCRNHSWTVVEQAFRELVQCQ